MNLRRLEEAEELELELRISSVERLFIPSTQRSRAESKILKYDDNILRSPKVSDSDSQAILSVFLRCII